mgnify:CR=1 FL=1
MAEKLTQGNHSIEKAFGIIEVMAHNQHPMRLLDIAAACKMSSSTVLRMLATMQNCGYVQQDEYTRYFLTIKFCHLSNLVSRQISIRNTVHPYLAELSQQVEEHCSIAIEREMTLVYIDEINASNAGNSLRIAESIGRTAMLHATGIGKLFLSRYDEKRLDYYIAQFGLPRFTPHTLTTKEALMENLAAKMATRRTTRRTPLACAPSPRPSATHRARSSAASASQAPRRTCRRSARSRSFRRF